jgi:hypothetical protein
MQPAAAVQVDRVRSKTVNRALAYKVRGDGSTEVYDLDFAAYCSMRGVTVADMIETYPRQYLFLFADGEDKIPTLAVDYTNSESARHADCVRRIKKAIRSTVPRTG